MNILICGAGGFIGAALAEAFERAGHAVVRTVHAASEGGRTDAAAQTPGIAIDYARDTDASAWLPRLAGIDVVVNAVGIIVERPGRRFDEIHRRAPLSLFDACLQSGVQRVIQISALGTADGDTPYFRSKRAADEHLMALPIDWQIVRPSLVYGEHGGSARAFRALASLPVLPLPEGGRQRLQPVVIDDLCAAVVRLAEPTTPSRQCVDLVGPNETTLRGMLASYRAGMGFGPALTLPVPGLVMDGAAALGDLIPGALFNRQTWRMLRAGNVGDVGATRALLGREPRPLACFITAERAGDLRQAALATWRTPLLRGALAFVWIATAVVSAFVHPLAASLDLLARVGLSGGAALVTLYGASLLDLALGLATLLRPGRRLWWFQLALIGTYTAIIAALLPEFLHHPFGPVTKNVPILTLLILLLAEENKP